MEKQGEDACHLDVERVSLGGIGSERDIPESSIVGCEGERSTEGEKDDWFHD